MNRRFPTPSIVIAGLLLASSPGFGVTASSTVSNDQQCMTITVNRNNPNDTAVKDLHFAKGPKLPNGAVLTVTVKDHQGAVLTGWGVSVADGNVNITKHLRCGPSGRKHRRRGNEHG